MIWSEYVNLIRYVTLSGVLLFWLNLLEVACLGNVASDYVVYSAASGNVTEGGHPFAAAYPVKGLIVEQTLMKWCLVWPLAPFGFVPRGKNKST